MTPGRDGTPCEADCGWPMDASAYAAGLRFHPTCGPPDDQAAADDPEAGK